MDKSFAVFILTHGRPDKIYTINALKKVGYSGKIYLVCDDEDSMLAQYKAKYGDAVHVFCKQEYFDKSDTFDIDGIRSVVLPARNFCFDLAKNLGLKYFLELDDDYQHFLVKGIKDGLFHDFREFKNFDKICDAYLNFLDSNDNILTVCFHQNGDFIGGKDGGVFAQKMKFKAMNSFFCKTSRPFQFFGRLNEDLTMSCHYGRMGKVVLTIGDMSLLQKETQQNSGGLTDAYLALGTYRKSFYSVIDCPSAVKIGAMGDGHARIHHNVSWEKVHPYILSEKWKRG